MDGGAVRDGLLVPDLLYHLHDDLSLVVELEFYTKRLFITRREAGFEVPSAAARDAAFQILGYAHVIDGPAGAQVRRLIQKPDAWSFRYLLVLGSELQEDFDRRSWDNLRQVMHRAGVETRTWDHYLNRLERIKEAAAFAGA